VGAATFEVEHRPDHVFIVRAGRVDVRVVGTRFRVEREPSRVSVAVHEGIVEVRRAGAAPVRLGRGESWTSDAAEPAEVRAPGVEPSAPDDARRASVDPESSDRGEEPRSIARRPRREAEPAPASDTPPAVELSLFDQANEHRRSGRLRDAAALYRRFYSEHPTDSRAGLAAFEAGRLRLEVLREPRAAAADFEAVLRLDTTQFRREIALAHLVRIARDGHAGDCASLRARYLRSFPNGVHAASIREQCER
jgi:transmembrane sensor